MNYLFQDTFISLVGSNIYTYLHLYLCLSTQYQKRCVEIKWCLGQIYPLDRNMDVTGTKLCLGWWFIDQFAIDSFINNINSLVLKPTKLLSRQVEKPLVFDDNFLVKVSDKDPV